MIEEGLEAAADQVAPAPAQPADNPFGAVIDNLDTARSVAIKQSLAKSADLTPERAADIQDISRQLGVPPGAVQENYDEYHRRAQQAALPVQPMHEQTPALAEWVKQPQNAAVAKDDFANLGFLEYLVTVPQRAFAQTVNQMRADGLRYQGMFRELTRAEKDQLDAYDYHAKLGGVLGGDSWWNIHKPIAGLGSFLANQVPIAEWALKGATYGAAVGLGAGLAAGPAAPIVGGVTATGAAAAGGAMGALYGVLRSTFEQEAAGAYQEFQDFRDERGNPLDPRVIKAAALVVGAINAPIEAGAQELLLESIPGLDKITALGRGGARAAVKQALRQPTIRAALFDAATSYAKTLTGETAQEVAQRFVAITAGELAKAAGQGHLEPGQLEPGTVDVRKQPRVTNPDGTVSTVDSLSVNLDGKEVLLPTVTADGRHFTGTDQERTDQAIAEYQRTGRHLGTFATPEAATAYAQRLHEDYATGRLDQGFYRTPQEITSDLTNEALQAASSFALGVAGGPAIAAARDVHRAQVATQNKAFFSALSGVATNSKTLERAPEAFQAFVAQATKDGPLETIYAPTDSWQAYWQSQNVDPALVAQELTGSSAAWDEAQTTGNLAISTAAYAAKLAATDHNAFFADEIRLQGPDSFNRREAEAFIKAQEQAAQEPATPSAAESIRATVEQKLVDAGVEPTTAATSASVFQAVARQAERAGVDPYAVFEGFGLAIERPEVQAPAATTEAVAPSVAAPLPGEAPAANIAATDVVPATHAGPEFLPGTYVPPEPGVATTAAHPAPPAVLQPATTREAIVANAAAMRAEDPDIEKKAAAMRASVANRIKPSTRGDTSVHDAALRKLEEGRAARTAGVSSQEAHAQQQSAATDRAAVSAAPQAGERLSDRAGEQPGADRRGVLETGGPSAGAVDRGLPSAGPGPAKLDEVFHAADAATDRARLTPGVVRELERIRDEFENFPFEKRVFIPGGVGVGGDFDEIRAGHAGAPVYDDVLYHAPVNERTVEGQRVPAKMARGTRQQVLDAVRGVLATGRIENNLAEGAVRVAERRNAGDWKDLSPTWLPPAWGDAPPPGFAEQLARDVEAATAPSSDLLIDEGGISEDDLSANVDTSFNVDEFSQSLFPDLQPISPTADGLTQPELPGAEGVQQTEQPTPAVAEAPFSLTSEIAQPRAPAQPGLFERPGAAETKEFFQGGLPAGYARIDPHIAEDERQNMPRSKAQAIVDVFKRLPKDVDYADVAQAGEARRFWYEESARTLREIFGIDTPRFVGLLAALSPRVSVEQNLLHTARVWREWNDRGRPTDAKTLRAVIQAGTEMDEPLSSWLPNAIKMLASDRPELETLSGPKVDSFALNLLGHVNEVTNDAWMAAFALVDQKILGGTQSGGKAGGYIAMNAKLRRVAERLTETTGSTWTPAQVQASVWSWAKTAYEFSQAQGLTVTQAVQQGLITDSLIAGTPGFDTLITQNTNIRQVLEEAGYGPIIAELERDRGGVSDDRAAAGAPGVQPPRAGAAVAPGVLRSARRLDRLREQRAAAREFGQPLNEPVALTPASVRAWAAELQQRVGPDLEHFDVSLDGNDDLHLDMLAVARGAQRAGLGTQVMQELTRFADLNGKRITLSPALRDQGWGTTSRSRLVQFYKRFGFVENKGRNIDFRISAGMYREPNVGREYGQLQPPFYSRLTRAVEASKQNVAPGAQWKAAIKNAKSGISRDEFAMARVDDLEDGTRYTKQQVLDYLEANRLKVETITMGDPEQVRANEEAKQAEIARRAEASYQAAVDAEVQRLEEQQYSDFARPIPVTVAFNEDEGGWEATVDGEDLGYVYDTEAEARDAAHEERDRREELASEAIGQDILDAARDNVDYGDIEREIEQEVEEEGDAPSDVHYEQYSEPGYKPGSYREVFLTVPQLTQSDTPAPAPEARGINLDDRHVLVAGGYRQLLESVESLMRQDTVGHNTTARQEVQAAIRKADSAADHFGYVGAAREQYESEGQALRRLLASIPEHGVPAGWQAVEGTKGKQWEDGHDEYAHITNPIVRLRFDERTSAAGERVLFLEEVQPPAPDQQALMPPLLLKHWREIAFKWALHYAASHGMTRVAWTTGEQQARRYSLERVVRSIEWFTPGEATVGVRADEGAQQQVTIGGGKRVVIDSTRGLMRIGVDAQGTIVGIGGGAMPNWRGQKLESVIGKEFADQIVAGAKGKIEGEDLKIGGQGLKRLYDVDFKNVVQSLPAVKREGGKVETIGLGTGRTKAEIDAEMDRVLEANGLADRLATDPTIQARLNALQAERNQSGGRFDAPSVPVTDSLRAAVLEGQPLFQGEDAGAPRRGAIRFGPGNQQVTIRLFERADLSTFLHESGHLFLELFADLADHVAGLDPSTLNPQQRELLADWGKVLTFLNVESRDQIDTPQHEQWARAFEAYLMEGKAPDVALQGAFARFRAWLLGIYGSLKQLHVDLTDEVRGVFDRMLASEQAIKDAEAQRGVAAMFTTAESAGMDAREFELYRTTIAKASATAREKLDQRLMREVQREREAHWKARREEVAADVRQGLEREPVYRALAAMQKGTHPDGTPLREGWKPEPLKLSRQAIVEQWGAERLKRLPRPYIYTADGGLHPDTVARLFGYTSGDELLTAVEQAPPLRAAVDQQTSARLMAEFGSILLDGTLHDQAQAAVANEDRDAIIRDELRALAKMRRQVQPFQQLERTRALEAATQQARERDYERRWFEAEAKLRIALAEGRKQAEIDDLRQQLRDLRAQARGGAAVIAAAIPSTEAIKAAAGDRIAQTRIGALKPATYWAAAQRFAQQAIERAARQDFDGAITAKQQQLLNLELYRQATAAQDDVDARVRFAKGLTTDAARKRLGLAGQNYLEQVDGVLERFEFTQTTQKQIARRASLRNFVEGLEAQGLPVDIPEEVLDDARRVNYKELTVEGLVGVTDGLKALVHLAQLKNRLLKNQDAREFAGIRDGIVASIRAENTAHPRPLEFTTGTDRKRAVADWFASHTKIATIVQALDGYKDGGPFWSAFIQPINAAADAEEARFLAEGRRYRKILDDHYSPRELGRLREQRFIPAIGASLTLEARLAVALNWGNQTSRDRLLSDPQRRWNQAQVQAILDTLTERDWKFVQATWDYIDSFWPEIKAKQERVVGLAPEKVEPTPVQTAYGEFRGGYYPLAYDGRLSVRAAQNELAQQAKLAAGGAYVRSTTKRGHVEARKMHVSLSVRLELGVMFQHLQQVVHDLTHHEMLIDTTRLLRDSQVSQAIQDTRGDIVYQQLARALQDIAIGATPAPHNVLDRAANFMRAGTQLSMLGLNLWTSLQQPLGMFNGMARVGPQWVMRGMLRWLRDAASMENTAGWINSVSPMMANRASTATQDLHEVRQSLRAPGGWFDLLVRRVSNDALTQTQITDAYLWHIAQAQRVADIPTWLGMYEKQMARGETEARAIALADQAVLDAQGGGQVKDLAQVQRGGPVARLFMTFYSYGNTVLNATQRAVGETNYRSPAQVAGLVGNLSLIYVMPALGTVALAHLFGRSRGGPDDTPWWEEVARESVATALNTMVLVRELQSLVSEGARGYAGPAGARALEVFYKLGQEIKQGQLDEGFWRALNTSGGIIFRYPAAQVQRTVDGWAALEEGRTQNPAVLLTGPPPKGK